MKPYGVEPGVADTGELRPRSGDTDYVPSTGQFVRESPDTIRTRRRRLKKKARQGAKADIQRAYDISREEADS